MLLAGIDVGTSSIKVSVVDARSGQSVAAAHYPETEADIIVPRPGWAEQSPELWWEHTVQAILKCNSSGKYNPKDIKAIGIAYQMHGLVLVDAEQNVLRNSIIWCDGRAIPYGDAAFDAIGEERCLTNLLNSPGNFTAAKLAWVKENEPEVYNRIHKIMLPGDFIAMKLTGEITTTAPALSEGIFWDFQQNEVSKDVMAYFDFNYDFIPTIQPLFAPHGEAKKDIAERLSLTPGIPVTYKAGDQPNNAFSLNVLNPGEVAATAGTSGVIYGVSDNLRYDPQSRINSFAHVNHNTKTQKEKIQSSDSLTPSPTWLKKGPGNEARIGVLLCINGTGIFNRWVRNTVGAHHSYESLNTEAAGVAAGSNGLMALPFGNGAERMLNNRTVGAHFHHLDFNIHTAAHLVRAAQEGIAFSFRYGLDIMRENGMSPSVIRAGRANLFLSDVFTEAFVNATGAPVEFYQTDGSVGAALGAGVGAKIYATEQQAFAGRKPLKLVTPTDVTSHDELYQKWKALLQEQLQQGSRQTKTANV